MRPAVSQPEEMASAGLLELLGSGNPPAFATDARHRVHFWNHGAERLLGRSAQHALGKVCFEIIDGRDLFGNRFCYERCPIFATVRKGEPASAFDLIIGTEAQRKMLAITALSIPGTRPALFTLVHILRPLDNHACVARLLAELSLRNPGPQGPCSSEGPTAADQPALTAREHEILAYVAIGLQNKEIAQRLEISLATVRNHVHNILEKLDVHSKLELVSLAFRRGWVSGAPSPRC